MGSQIPSSEDLSPYQEDGSIVRLRHELSTAEVKSKHVKVQKNAGCLLGQNTAGEFSG